LTQKIITFYTRQCIRHLNHIRHQTNKHQPHQHNRNQVHSNIKLNPTYKRNGCISFLDLPVIRNESNLEIDMYRKPTTTDTTINFLCNHPMEHKIAAYKHHITRTHSLPLTPQRKQAEQTLIQLIAQNNNFPQKLIQNLNQQIQRKKKPSKEKSTGTKNHGLPSLTTGPK